mmetsp:Transcript_17479/g.20167  ORF Transcript_17479/g.20167 Transcript_17479/m.20167 type:complete len:641 (+) Transcript_17479:57-1979(+)|eukprot:CAMPEP_0194140626 /NCGR_PEP_ID=MMETSP0152-20130528/10159_1 /TAXON_ID=1049557 /ORGANISM="Thalassiothrix antarctica, Strain L6-D1" /LENGTH=640 /DNA_ID=CAMNT_0038838957 /DNA_START=114 /DNA_END=2036 /DNA_ORIENTATION=+
MVSKNPDNSQSGMSRAAKKRAKKREKKQNEENNKLSNNKIKDDEKNTIGDEIDDLTNSKENVKRKGVDDNTIDSSLPKKIKPDEDDNIDRNDEMDEDVQSNEEVHKLIAQLKLVQILQQCEIEEEEAFVDLMGEKIDLRVLLQELTSKERATCFLQAILGSSVTVKEFYEKYWEKEPLLVQRKQYNNKNNRLDGFLSLKSIRKLTKSHPLAYGKDLNVTRYEMDKIKGIKRRVTYDKISEKEGDFILADHNDIWSKYNDGCTIRLLCPQQNSETTHALLSTLELEWGCMVGSNVYLTPPGDSQGFSPHYDDVCAYILQLEGKKHWKVYPPQNKAEILPRFSSDDYNDDDTKNWTAALDVVLEKGDVLYIPRGWIHQACTLPTSNEHSLHLTASAMQQWSWVDYLELLLPEALEAAAASDSSTSVREGLPRNFLDYMGAVYYQPEESEILKELRIDKTKSEGAGSIKDSSEREREDKRKRFIEEAKNRILRVTNEAFSMLDSTCDQMGKRFLSDRLPPAFVQQESSLTNEHQINNGGRIIYPNTMCRLVRPGIARLALEEEMAILYHCADNSLVYHETPLSPLEFEMDDAPCIEALLTTIEPHWIMVKDLIHDDIEDKVEITQTLYNEGILAILQPQKPEN